MPDGVLIATMICEQAYGGTAYSVDDKIEVYYDDTLAEFNLTLNGSDIAYGDYSSYYISEWQFIGWPYSPPASDDFSITGVIFQDNTIYSTYAYCDGNNYIQLEHQREFPYFKLKTTINSSHCVIANLCDLRKEGTLDIVNETSSGAADGSLTISVYDSQASAVKCELATFNYGSSTNNMTEGSGDVWTYTFTGLTAGTYTIYVVDDKYCNISFNATIRTEPNHGLLYWWEYTDLDGLEHKVEILERDYSGSTTEKTYLGAAPVQLSLNGEDVMSPVLPSSLNVTVRNITQNEFQSIVESQDELKYKAKIYTKPAASWVMKWQGMIVPEIFSHSWDNLSSYDLQMQFTDRMADLDQFEFTDKGRDTVANIIRSILNKTDVGNDYRFCFNTYEDSFDSTDTDDPFTQTYLPTHKYFKNENVPNCREVLEDVLRTFGCRVFSYEGYWYVTSIWEQGQSFDYREYDKEGQYQANGTINPLTDLKAPTASSRAAQMRGGNKSYDAIYSEINVISKRDLAESICTTFSKENATTDPLSGVSGPHGFTGWDEKVNGAIGSWIVSQRDDDYVYKSKFKDEYLGVSYIVFTSTIEYNDNDTFSIEIPYFIEVDAYHDKFVTNPYFRINWQLKLGSYYLGADGTWSTTVTTNVYFAESKNKKSSFTINGIFRDVSTTTTETMEFRLYDVSALNYDVTVSGADSNVISEVEGWDTNTATSGYYPLGTRRVVYHSSEDLLYFYELKQSSEADTGLDIIEATDITGNKWYRESTVNALSGDVVFETSVEYFTIAFTTKPGGTKIPEEAIITAEKETAVKKLNYPIEFFDVDTTVNNSERLVTNYLTKADGTPTTSWGGVTIQRHLLNTLSAQYNKPRGIVDVTLRTDVEVPFYNVIRDTLESNKIYLITSMTVDFKTRQHRMRLHEITGDTSTGTGAYSSGYSSGYDI